jgi:hypothetical protein
MLKVVAVAPGMATPFLRHCRLTGPTGSSIDAVIERLMLAPTETFSAAG